MEPNDPDEQERAVRDRLITLVDGRPPRSRAAPAEPAERPRDWLDDIIDAPASPAPEPKTKPRMSRKAPEQEEPASETDDEGDSDDDQDERKPATWDPVAIADRIVHAYQQRPATERLKHAAQVVVHSRAQIGQLIYTASGVWAAWRIGFTPWLLHFTADAPEGVPVFFVGLGWLVNRRFDAAPMVVAWIGRAAYTATVINLVLHP